MHWTKKSEKPPSLSTKTETQSPNWANSQTVQDTKTEKPQIFSAKTKNSNQKLAKSVKPKIPAPPPFKMIRQNTK